MTCCSWTNDGQYLALGLYNGLISIRNKVINLHSYINALSFKLPEHKVVSAKQGVCRNISLAYYYGTMWFLQSLNPKLTFKVCALPAELLSLTLQKTGL